METRSYNLVPETEQIEKEHRGEKWEEGLRMVTPQMIQVQSAGGAISNYQTKEVFKSPFAFLDSVESMAVDKYLAC